MFRVKESEVDGTRMVAEWVVQVALLFALLANFGCAYFILEEFRRLGAALDNPRPMPLTDVASLRHEVGVQVAVSLVLPTILAVCVGAIWWLRRRYLSSQKSLRQVKMLAHDILASMDRGVVTTNREAAITSINSATMELLGVDIECVGRPLASICPPDVSLIEVYREVVGNQAAVRSRDFNVYRAGSVLRLRVDGHVLKDAEGTSVGCVIHLQNVTERILMEERMRRMERFISLATLASGLHHEIKNPLTALSIHIQLLEESLSNGLSGGQVDELVGVLKTEVCRLNGVLESFRSFANLQHLTIHLTDALRVVENAIRLIRPQAAEQRVQITLLHPEKQLPPVPLDADKFEQAVLNIVINALEAMPEGGHLTIGATVEDGELRVSVQDSGPGIPPEIRPNLFQPYYSTKDRGSGMGLALSEKLISQHGGRIGYRTGPEGTTFEIAIPLREETETHE
jgi:two-component system, NtrC family, sensor histidine kinase HydH